MTPCEHCPIITWGLISDPQRAEGERAIRADEARVWRNTLERAGKRVERLNERIDWLSAQIERLEDEKRRLKAENEQLKQRRSA